MSTRTTIVASLTATIARAEEIIAAVAAGSYTSAAQYESDVNAVRRSMADLVTMIEQEWGLSGLASIVALRALGARLLELRARIVEGTTVVTTVVDRPRSLMELAADWYDDPARWRELRRVNPGLRHPGFVPAGWEVVRHAR